MEILNNLSSWFRHRAPGTSTRTAVRPISVETVNGFWDGSSFKIRGMTSSHGELWIAISSHCCLTSSPARFGHPSSQVVNDFFGGAGALVFSSSFFIGAGTELCAGFGVLGFRVFGAWSFLGLKQQTFFLILGPKRPRAQTKRGKTKNTTLTILGGGRRQTTKEEYTPRISLSGTWCKDWLTCPQSELPLVRQNVRPVQWVAILLRLARVLEVQSGSAADCRPHESGSGVRKTTGELGTRRGVGDPADTGQARGGWARP